MLLQPVQLLQHGPGRGSVFVGQVEEVGQQGQVVQGQRFRRVQWVLLSAGNVWALGHVGLHGLLFQRVLLHASWQKHKESFLNDLKDNRIDVNG